MRVLIHNTLMCLIKNCNTYPLLIQGDQVEEIDVEFNKDFVIKIIGRLDWAGLVSGAANVGY